MEAKRLMNDNQNDIGRRLQREMKKRGMSSVELAKRADVKTSFLYDVISGKSANPSSIKLARVAESLGISLTYLAGTSDSPMDGYQFSLPQQSQDYVVIPSLRVEQGRLLTYEDRAATFQFRKDWLDKKLGIAPQDLRMLSVQGDNMQPSLCHGDMLMVDTTQKYPTPPGIFVLFDGMGLVVKRLETAAQSDKPKLRISCDNPQYSAYDSPADEVTIVGRVVWFSRDI